MTTLKPDTIRIIRSGNGKARAVPSPKELSPGETFNVKNWTHCKASVDFAKVPVAPAKCEIEPRETAVFTVDGGADPDYYEYEVTLACSVDGRDVEQYVEGGSRPGLIIDR